MFTLYDADNATNQAPFWSENLGTLVPQADVDCSATDIATLVGIIGTPTIDTTSQTMYLVTKIKNPDATYHQWLHALDIITGAEKFGGPVAIAAMIGGTNAFSAKLNNQRAALLLQGGNVYITWSSHNDCPGYHGIVAAYNASTLAQVGVWDDTPTGTKGGIWMSGGGLVGDGTNIYLATGNGDFNASSGGANYGESILGLNSSLSSVLTYFTPTTWSTLNGKDQDLGGCPLLLIPGTRLLVIGGKDHNLYLVNADNMGTWRGLQSFSIATSEIKGGLVAFNGPAGLLVCVQPSGTSLCFL